MEEFGYPPQFPVPTADDAEEEKTTTAKENENSKVDNKAKSKKVD